ncbi:MAG TPA: long-chain fatty acid--CoA ligase [Gammaproteobacteria bacterium]|nr:long-chain fatty acid--CoA ligase [Gammaproteobacteria bacterium]MCH77768.1 long-chain fatty acid--CoA ligase [Gammaproteobacteria bacterium]
MSAATRHDVIPWQQAGTVGGLLRERVARSPEAIAYRFHEGGAWQALTWKQLAARVGRFQAALRAEGLAPGSRVAVMLPNGPDWVCFDLAALSLGLVVVPLYRGDRPDNAAYVLEHAGACLLLADAAECWEGLVRHGGLAGLRRVVLTDGDVDGGRVQRLDRWLPAHGEFRVECSDGDALASIVYTSGTTGRPKGVMLSHHNLLWNAAAAECMSPVAPDDLFLSFLPLSHTLERTVGYYLPMLAGATVAFSRGIEHLADDLKAVRPTLLVSVPRVFERTASAVRGALAGRPAPLRWAFEATVALGWRDFERQQGRAAGTPLLMLLPLLRRVLARPVLERLGGRLRLAICGGAALPPTVSRLFIGLGLPLLQGYGLTEASPVLTVNTLDANRPDSVGLALPDVELRLSGEGELLARSPGLMAGYWRDADASATALDADGWLHTGDLAAQRGRHWYITGRLKDIIVLANGEKVPPVDIEHALMRDPLIHQAMLVGEGRPWLAAVLVLQAESWALLARELGLDPRDEAALAEPQAEKAVLARAEAALHAFPGYARLRRVHLTLEEWTEANGLLTATHKLRRSQCLARYRAAIEGFYEG